MAYNDATKRCHGTAMASEVPAAGPIRGEGAGYIDVVLKDGPFDDKMGQRVGVVVYTTIETAYNELGAGIVRRILDDNERIDVTIPVTYSVWSKE